ncbi:hypothetical protein HDU96_004258 [Phlyctochytrium bullatum]|nr:hypothetical protein HDU96_004258 [Phlyctochytrium bullatum]
MSSTTLTLSTAARCSSSTTSSNVRKMRRPPPSLSLTISTAPSSTLSTSNRSPTALRTPSCIATARPLSIANTTTNHKHHPSLSISTTHGLSTTTAPAPLTAPVMMMDNHSPSINYYPDGPAEILPNLYLGSEHNASDPAVLARFGVRCVLNVAKEVTNPLLEAKADQVPLTSLPISSAGVTPKPFALAGVTSDPSLWTSASLPFSPRPLALDRPKQLPLSAEDFEGGPSPSPTDSTAPSSATMSPASLAVSDPVGADLDAMDPMCLDVAVAVAPAPTPAPLPAYLKLPWGHGEAHLASHFGVAFAYIDAAVTRGLPVLVACQQGVSRSASLVIGYVMARRGMGLQEAYRFVKERSPHVCPNVGFLAQLAEFEMMMGSEVGGAAV